jgi:MarR family transcriptional regulator, organic hydroperoxide resistance regulator
MFVQRIMRLSLDAAPGSQPGDDALQLMQLLLQLAHALQVRSRRMLRKLGVTAPQRVVVRVVGQTPGIAPRDIAAALRLHPSTLTGVLSRLERDGLIDRRADPADGRRSRIWLTRTGRRVHRERRGTVEAAVRRALGRADRTAIEKTEQVIRLLIEELERE